MTLRRIWLLIGYAGLLVTTPAFASGQGLRVSPWVGLYAPTSDLGSIQAVDFGKKESTLAYGADLDFGGQNLIGFRAGGGYASSSDVPVDGVGCVICSARATVLTATGAVVIRPFPAPLIRPYGVVGAGWKWYDFDFDEPVLDGLVGDQAVFTWQAGAGVILLAGSAVTLFAELSDFMSDFDFETGAAGNTQHDLFLKVGVSLGLGGR